MTMTKRVFLLFLVAVVLFPLAVFAQEGRPLEIEYPEIEGERPETVKTSVPEYVKYIFNFFIWAAGIIALVVLVNAGFEYFTSAGSPEKITSAKEKIKASLLGLLILFGSYLILIFINPNLVVFHLPRIRPIMSQLTPGVLVCRKETRVMDAWRLVYEYKFSNPTIEREKEIQKEMDLLLDKIALNCYPVLTAGDIRPDYDNKIEFIYFIPNLQTDPEGNLLSATEYGAIIYEGENFGGKSKPFYLHLLPGGLITVYEIRKEWGEESPGGEEFPDLKPSSIKPFQVLTEPDPNWKVTLYGDFNENMEWVDVEPGKESYFGADTPNSCNAAWYCDFDLAWSPKSIRVEGELLAILLTEDGRSDTFSGGVDNNLEDNRNIVDWVDCKDYHSEVSRGGEWVGSTWGGYFTKKQCARAAAKQLVIISASIY